MGKHRLSCHQLTELIKDEKQASRQYKRMGLPKLAADERRHKKFFEHLKKETCN